MNIFIAGGGRVGTHLARLLSGDNQNVTMIEADPNRLEQIDYNLDVSTAHGDGASVMLLQKLGVPGADLFVASMGNDQTNLIAAATAKGLGAKQVVARVDNPMYIDANILYESILGIDYILSPDALAALEMAHYIEHPGVLVSQDFGRGIIQMRQVRVTRSPTTGGRTLKDVLKPGSGVLLGVVDRKGKSSIPHGDTIVEPGDQITLIGKKDRLEEVQRLFQETAEKPSRVAIMGGGTIGLRLAKVLESKLKTVKLFERREHRCEELAALLKKTKVVLRDATSRIALEQEHIDTFDVFVAATNDDERNIMASVLAKEVGVKMVVAIVHQPDFAPLVERLGIDLAVTPRTSIANKILKLVHQGEFTSLAVLSEGQVEVMEFALNETSPVLGNQLREIRHKLPRNALIATILRNNEVIVPSGEDMLLAGDSIVLIVSAEGVEAARRVLQKR
ncbi:MAG: Trk system potassium transporter TrkA [Candidatus Hydrogenedentes bacterium]|nr:Trk system potassium transporter TrkA [Candidatus Hydrogenedentota bacterium]